MTTGTHYVDAGGQHRLPGCLVRRRLRLGSRIVREYDRIAPEDAGEIRCACRALGIMADTDSSGALRVGGIGDAE